MPIITETLCHATLQQHVSELIQNRAALIGVVGLGYVGLPLVLLLSEQKFKVTGFDIEKSKVDTVTRGGSYIVRIPGTEIQSTQRAGFTATSDYSRIAEMDAVLIAVPTPLNDHPEPDLSYIVATAEAIAPHLRPGQLVVLESTTYPGTTEELLVPILEKNPRRLKAAWRQQRRTDVLCSFLAGARRSGNDTVARADIPKVVGGSIRQRRNWAANLMARFSVARYRSRLRPYQK